MQLDVGGLIPSPTSPLAQTLSAVTLETLEDRLVMLQGEAGSGKTTDAERHAAALGARALLVPAGRFDSARDIEARIREFVSRRDPDGAPAMVLLDGVDEVSFSLRADRLVESLGPAARLRVICRTGGWPDAFERDLRQFGARRFELVPLSSDEVRALAALAQVDGDAFLREVRRVGVETLAMMPITLAAMRGEALLEHRVPPVHPVDGEPPRGGRRSRRSALRGTSSSTRTMATHGCGHSVPAL